MQWFNIDKAGLAKLLDRKGKQFVLNELLSNSWDENTTKVEVSLERLPGTRYVQLRVTDDNPHGFADLSHAFTLFAESAKKGQDDKRGRFNLGEKLVLALCEDAQIVSTRGGISFDGEGRNTLRTKTARGSVFTGRLRMTNEELQTCQDSVLLLLPPPGVETLFNGVRLASRKAVTAFEPPSKLTH